MNKYYISLEKAAQLNDISVEVVEAILSDVNVTLEDAAERRLTYAQYQLFNSELTRIQKEQKYRQELDAKYGKGTVVEVSILHLISPSQVITSFTDGFIGRLPLAEISWNIPDAERIFSALNINQVITCVVLEIDFQFKQIKLSQKRLVKHPSDLISWERLDRGDELNGKILEELSTSYLVESSKGFFGLLSKDLVSAKLGESLKVRIHSKSDSNALLTFVPASLEIQDESRVQIAAINDFGLIEPELRDFYSLKKSILGAHATDQDLTILKEAFENYPDLFSKEIEVPSTLYLAFEQNSSSYEVQFKANALPYYFPDQIPSKELEAKLLETLGNQPYWIRFNQRPSGDNKAGFTIDFSFFTEDLNINGVVQSTRKNFDTKFSIRNFSFGQNVRNASESNKRNAKHGAFLYRSPIRIVSPFSSLPESDSQKLILDAILKKTECIEIINRLRQDSGEILRQEGRTLSIIDKFLEYQEGLLDATKEQSVYVDKFERAHSDTGSVAILIDQKYRDSLEIEDGVMTIVVVRIGKSNGSDEELVWFADAAISATHDKCKLEFRKEISVENLKRGFYLERKLSKRQLRIQREIIQDFLLKKVKIDHIESLLVRPNDIKSPILSGIELINPDLATTEKEQPDNNQVKAVRKAVGNQNIFLIQGPPGTGKTTVIAEIIEQLVAKGEKILVSGQNHVAVDNVLAKIARIPKINLLRVGKEEKIDKELGRFHIDQLVLDYQEIFTVFLQNQLVLIKEYYDFKVRNIDVGLLAKHYNARVTECCIPYGVLTEQLKHRHYILRDGLKELSTNEIQQTIIVYENWIKSLNNEIEILLKPLIYNSVDVVFATCIGVKTDNVFRESGLRFDTVIIDEAGKANIAESLVPIELGKKVILVGDQMQLPPYIDSSLIDVADAKSFPRSKYGSGFLQDEIVHALKTSFFEFLITRIDTGKFPAENLEMLNYQHRMHPNIGEFISRSFYNSKVLMGSRTHLNKLDFAPPFNKEIVFFDTSNAPNPYEQTDGYSSRNDTEASTIAESILPKLFENNVSPSAIAIIAPYKSQVANIVKQINQSTLCRHKNIDVSTLDSFQGREYDIIIFSFTRSSDHKKAPIVSERKKYVKVGFLDDARRLNVAFSRAKKKLILIGNAITLTDKRSHYDLLFDYTRLFDNLVRLSKKEEIGNFVSVADHHDFRTPFERFCEKHKEGDFVISNFVMLGIKTGRVFGAFFKIENCDCLLPISLVPQRLHPALLKLDSTVKCNLVVHSIDLSQKRITVRFAEARDKPAVWAANASNYTPGMIVRGEVISIANFGYFIKLDCGLEGLLHNSRNRARRVLSLNQQLDVVIQKIDQEKMQIWFSLEK